jgi:hypothetical protein
MVGFLERLMKQAKLKRIVSNEFGTFGQLSNSINNLVLFTVELPWLENKNNISCISVGKYICKWTKSPRLKKYTYEITKVSKRSGIRIHAGNFPKQILGCVGLGLKRGTMDGQQGIFSSQTAIRKFETIMNKEDFELEIKI